jgi:hypothetical protein
MSEDDLEAKAIKEQALWLGMDLEKDAEFLFIAEEALKAPLPPGNVDFFSVINKIYVLSAIIIWILTRNIQ